MNTNVPGGRRGRKLPSFGRPPIAPRGGQRTYQQYAGPRVTYNYNQRPTPRLRNGKPVKVGRRRPPIKQNVGPKPVKKIPDNVHELLTTEKKRKSKKVKQIEKAISRVPVDDVSTTTAIVAFPDGVSLNAMIEATMIQLGMRADFNMSVPSYYWYLYFTGAFYMHMKRCGQLTGTLAQLVPDVNGTTMYIPFGIAKFFEYYGKYTEMAEATINVPFMIDVNWNAGFYMGMGMGDGAGSLNREGLPAWAMLFQIQAFETIYDVTDATQTSQQPSNYQFNTTCPATPLDSPLVTSFATFFTSPQVISQMSSVIKSLCSCISLAELPTCAPDSSAWAQLGVAQSTSPNTPIAQPWRGIDKNFHPETALMLNLDNAKFTNSAHFQQPNPLPSEPLNDEKMPYYMEIYNTLAYIGFTMDKYVPGKLFESMTYHGMHLNTLFKTRQWIDTYAFTSNLTMIYQGNYNGKSISVTTPTVLDPNARALWAFHASALYTLQAQLNIHFVDQMNCPWISLQDNNVWCPQVAYADRTWEIAEYYPEISNAIAMIAPVVVDGKLRVPACYYNTQWTNDSSIDNCNTPGPIQWSELGWNIQNEVFNVPFTYSTAIANANTTNNYNTIVPNFILTACSQFTIGITNETTAAHNYDFIAEHCGPFNAGSYEYFQPYVLNGPWGATVYKYYDTWWKANYTTNVPPRTQVPHAKMGDNNAMLHHALWSQNANLTQALVTAITTNEDGDTNLNSTLMVALPAPDSIMSATRISSLDAVKIAIWSWSSVTNSTHSSSTMKQRRWKIINNVHKGLPGDTTQGSAAYVSRFFTDLPSGSNWGMSIYNYFSKQINPNSPFTADIAKLEKAQNLAGASGRGGVPRLDEVINNYLLPFSKNLFKGQRSSPITSASLGPSLKGVSEDIAPILGAYLSSSGMGDVKTKNPGGKRSLVKFVKRLPGMVKKGIDLGKKAKGMADEVGAVLEML